MCRPSPRRCRQAPNPGSRSPDVPSTRRASGRRWRRSPLSGSATRRRGRPGSDRAGATRGVTPRSYTCFAMPSKHPSTNRGHRRSRARGGVGARPDRDRQPRRRTPRSSAGWLSKAPRRSWSRARDAALRLRRCWCSWIVAASISTSTRSTGSTSPPRPRSERRAVGRPTHGLADTSAWIVARRSARARKLLLAAVERGDIAWCWPSRRRR
jgi:hypothetical protein